MAKSFRQLSEEAMAQAHAVSAEEALVELSKNPDTLLVDVRDADEVEVTGLGFGAINAPGRSLAWKACQEFDPEYREPELQDRLRRILTTCGMSPCYRGASAANLLREMGFAHVSYVNGGMKALLAAGLACRKMKSPPV